MLKGGLIEFPPGTSTPVSNPGAGHLWNFGMTLSGTADEIFPTGSLFWKAGDCSILKPFGLHGWRVPMNSSWRILHFLWEPEPEQIPLLDLPEIAPSCCRFHLKGLDEERHIRHAMLEAYAYMTGGFRPVDTRLAYNALTRALLWLNRVVNPPKKVSNIHIDKALCYIRKNIGQSFSLSDIARAAGVSASQLYLLFMREYNVAPMTYIENERMNIAAEMLGKSSFSIKEIALQCGYSDQRYFASRFKFHKKCSPSDFRSKHMADVIEIQSFKR